MEKLFKLLQLYVLDHNWNEKFELLYNKETGKDKIHLVMNNRFMHTKIRHYDTDCVIISKRFWFILWLIEHKHINIYKLMDARHQYYKVCWTYPHWKAVDLYENVLAVIAVHDDPVEYLSNYLN